MVITKRKAIARLGAAAVAAALAAPLMTAVATSTASAAKSPAVVSFPRAETLYTSGTMYSPPTSWNPFNPGNNYTGTQGLVYEPLFRYDPLHGKYIPWLATSGTWTNATTYVIQVRNGVTWSNGSPLTGADVAYSINLAENPAIPYSALVSEGLIGATASGNTVTVTFKSPAPYVAWQTYLWNWDIVPQAIWSKVPAKDDVTVANTNPVGSGPLLLVKSSITSTQACYQFNTNWWAIKQLGLSFHFKYLCDSVNASNNVELSAIMSNDIDWSNNFLPGINTLITIGGNNFITTYYPSNPYMLSANTAWIELNTSKAPMSNVNFRKAVAYAIDPQQVVTGVYTGIVEAANPTGLMPNLASFINQGIVKQYGFSYNPAKAKAFLKASGYAGQKLTLEVPDGWTDWMAAIQVIASDLNAVGINVVPTYPSYNTRTLDLENGTFDMAIDNNATIDASPYSYFDRVYQLPLTKPDLSQLNWERYTSPADWALVEKAATTPLSDTAALDSIYGSLEKDFLQALPEIPLWYNGAWFQANTTYWKDYPTSTVPSLQNTPVLWRGTWGGMTIPEALAALQPVPPAKKS
ncbi:MAG TPA: ABC transporter substrate-binding protein [Acidimicrobiales bacterium]|nr:ABC transporter substrate-binding protein [Acidimicrobiales bacterium]